MTDFTIKLQEQQRAMLYETQMQHCAELNKALHRAKQARKPDTEMIRIREEHYNANIEILAKLVKEVRS